MRQIFFILGLILLLGACSNKIVVDIPLAEHPRPDFQRSGFINLNGTWNFTFNDSLAENGLYDKKIIVPFSWGSRLSGVDDESDIAWYSRAISVPKSWKGKRVFLVIGASDWKTDVSLNKNNLGTHTGGYTPFEFEITDLVSFGGSDTLSIKVDDTYSDAHLYGKQGYGNVRGIWQTPYLEARGNAYISQIHFTSDIDLSRAVADITTNGAADGETVTVAFRNGEYKPVSASVENNHVRVEIPMPDQHLWTLEDPYLYDVTISLTDQGKDVDNVDSYFGQRKISTITMPGHDYSYVALNNKPIYLKLCLDQSYHPDGFYTFPSDEFMKQEIMLSKKLGLNGNRVHIKTEIPRKLYWADKLGLLIMADIPCYFGPATDEAKQDWEYCMRNQIDRDFNHPSIFSWVNFNETWGLYAMEGDKKLGYTKDIQQWVRDMYLLTKSLDPTRLVDDNSACNHDHVQTDINSWHAYTPNYRWEEVDSLYDVNTYPGSPYNFTEGNTQTGQPMFNCECGNVWGYNGCAGDCDYTWDYHEMMNAFHRHLKIAGWLYTEHHDVINEWNGYVRYDRSAKDDGLSDIIDGMGIKDFHSDYYIVPSELFYLKVPAGSTQNVKLLSSFTTDKDPGKMTLETTLSGSMKIYDTISFPVEFKPFQLEEVAERKVSIPEDNGVYVLSYVLKDPNGNILHRNFSLFAVTDGKNPDNSISLNYSDASWTIKQTSVLDGKKIDGFGSGWFEFTADIPSSFDAEKRAAHLLFEASSNKLLGKDMDDNAQIAGEYHLGKGTFDPCKSSNAYSMTDTTKWTSKVQVSVNGKDLGTFNLEDNPADHRGVLSWISQPHDLHMYEAGSYGYLIDVNIPAGTLKTGKATIRLSVPESAASDTSGGLAIYGKDFGRYPLDPTIIFE